MVYSTEEQLRNPAGVACARCGHDIHQNDHTEFDQNNLRCHHIARCYELAAAELSQMKGQHKNRPGQDKDPIQEKREQDEKIYKAHQEQVAPPPPAEQALQEEAERDKEKEKADKQAEKQQEKADKEAEKEQKKADKESGGTKKNSDAKRAEESQKNMEKKADQEAKNPPAPVGDMKAKKAVKKPAQTARPRNKKRK